MRNLYLYLVVLPGFIFTVQAQKRYASQNPFYILHVDSADYFYENGKYKECIPHYEEAICISNKGTRSRMRLSYACLYTGDTVSFREKFTSLVSDFPEYFCKESSFYKKEFDELNIRIVPNEFNTACNSWMKKYDTVLLKEIMDIRKFDQGIRNGHLKKEDFMSHYYYHERMTMREIDSVNLARMEKIFEAYGYPGRSLVSNAYSSTGWLVIQHSNLLKMKKYYPLIEEAVKNGETDKWHLAYLIDRIRMNEGKCQVYGSQLKTDNVTGITKLWPVENIENVNRRREEVGLGKLEEYVRGWGITDMLLNKCQTP